MNTKSSHNGRFVRFLTSSLRVLIENSVFLIMGALVGLVWANVDAHSYHEVAHTLHFAINDVAMAFFFLIAGKEIREAMLPGGPLSSARTAALPLLATLGGMLGPAGIYVAGTVLFNSPELTRAGPCRWQPTLPSRIWSLV